MIPDTPYLVLGRVCIVSIIISSASVNLNIILTICVVHDMTYVIW